MNKVKAIALETLTRMSNAYTTIAISAALGILGFLTLGTLAFVAIPLVMGVGAGAITSVVGDKLLQLGLKKSMSNIWIRLLSGFGLLCGVTLVFSMEFPAFIAGSLFSGCVYFLSVYLNTVNYPDLKGESSKTEMPNKTS